MSTTHGVAPFPLYWPLEYPRTKYRTYAKFQVDFVTARSHLLGELSRLGATDVVLSSNIPIRRDGLPGVPDKEPQDPGVAVYFRRKQKSYVLACDHYDKVRWNLRALGATIEALRSIERHGSSTMLDQAFSGFAQLPASTAPKPRPWTEVLGLSNVATLSMVRERYNALALERHPDRGGSHEAIVELNRAKEDAERAIGGGA